MVGIYSKKSKTSRNLAEMLGFPLFYPKTLYKPDVSAIIRWGTTVTGSWKKEFNTKEAISHTANKPLARSILLEAGVPVPTAGENVFPCVGRPVRHTKGRKFFYCNNAYDVKRAKRRGAVYFSSFYPKTNEYRVHIGGGKLLAIARKQEGDISSYNWNYSKGFRFKYLHSFEWDIEAIRIAKKAIKTLGLDFGAVDVMADPTDETLPHVVVCEVNTAPALCNYTLNKYASLFKKIGKEYPDEIEQEKTQQEQYEEKRMNYMHGLIPESYEEFNS